MHCYFFAQVTLSKKTQRALQRERETYQHKQAEKEAWAATRDANFKAGRISLLEHPVWNRATLVTPIKADGDMFFDNEATRATAEDLEGKQTLFRHIVPAHAYQTRSCCIDPSTQT